MSSEGRITAEFDALLADAIDRRLDDAQLARFTQLLAEPETVDYYVDHAILHAMLQWEHALPLDEAIASPLSELLPLPAISPSERDNASSLPGILSTAFHGTIGFFSQELPFSLLIATALTGLGLWLASLIYVSSPEKIARDSLALPANSPVNATQEVVGKITGMADCKGHVKRLGIRDWGLETAGNQKSLVALGDKFILSAGLLEITYNAGAKVILQGPVTYEVDACDGGYLSVGKLTARLEKKQPANSGQQSAVSDQRAEKVASDQWPAASNEGSEVRGQGSENVTSGESLVASGRWAVASEWDPKSQNPEISKSPISNPQSPIPNPSSSPAPVFAVRTPSAVVTDLGTEFGVEVNEAGETDTQVFVGSVQIASTGAPGHKHIKQTQTLVAGQYARVGKNRIISAADRDFQKLGARFARIMPRPLNLGDEYAKLVLSMNPVVYYRMDQWPVADGKNRYVLVDSAPGGHHGVACFDPAFGKPSSPGKFGGALDLHGSMGSEYAFVKNYPKAENGQLSVSAWVWPITLDPWVGVTANWYNSPKGEEMGQFAFGVGGTAQLWAQILQQDGHKVKVCENISPLPQSIWHHVAFVADGAVLSLYHNGILVDSIPYHGIIREPIPEYLSIGCAMDKDGLGLRPMNAYQWNGRLDEIAVFNHALSVKHVKQLCKGPATTK